ncbi:MAG: hypothetical protein HYX48_05975 [Chlamydiales bacterium]|nr:hypothetical protein [Chlamydiales bacterium]
MSTACVQFGLLPFVAETGSEPSSKRRRVSLDRLTSLATPLIAYILSYLPLKELRRDGFFTICKDVNTQAIYRSAIRTLRQADNFDVLWFQRISKNRFNESTTYTHILDSMEGMRHLTLCSESRNGTSHRTLTLVDQTLASKRADQLTSFTVNAGLYLDVRDAQVKKLATTCTALTKLDLRNCRQTTDFGISHLVGLKLESLSLHSNRQITDTSCVMLGGIPSLTYLSLSNCSRVAYTGVDHLLQTLPKLRFFEAGGDIGGGRGDASWAISMAIARHGKNLESLSLEPCFYHAAHLVEIAQNCKKLVRMAVGGYRQREFYRDLDLNPLELAAALKRHNPRLEVTGLKREVQLVVARPVATAASAKTETRFCTVQ